MSPGFLESVDLQTSTSGSYVIVDEDDIEIQGDEDEICQD